MIFFASTEEVEQMEADLASAEGAARLPHLLALAWQMRQRDCARALALADETEELQSKFDIASLVGQGLRLMLIRGEVKWLFGELDAAQSLAQAALQGFSNLQDVLGAADAHWLLAWVAWDRGNMARTETELEAMAYACTGVDPVRLIAAQAAFARVSAFSNVTAAKALWSQYFASSTTMHPAARCWIEEFFRAVAEQTSDHVNDIMHLSQNYALALATGQIRRAMSAAAFIGNAFNDLNDYHSALEWMQRGLALAREKGWPGMIANALTCTAETLRRLRRFDQADQLLQEALSLLSSMSESRQYAFVLKCHGDVELARTRYASALAAFQLLEQRGVALRQPDLQFMALCGCAQAWLELGQPQAALQAAHNALSWAKANPEGQVNVLRVLAAIHIRYKLPDPAEMTAASAALHYLQQAQSTARSIENYSMPYALLESLAQEYARQGDYEDAWQWGQQAAQAREESHSREANNRVQAMQLSYQTEREQAEEAHRRELASEAKRVEILQQTSETLEHLGAIGQEITAHLDAQHVFDALHQHIHHLFDVTGFAIYLMNPDGVSLNATFAEVDDRELEPWTVYIDDITSNCARCARERREILVNDNNQSGIAPRQMPGSHQIANSMLFAPLLLADKVMGVMTIQSTRHNAYTWGAREQMILRTLCAYTAIALSNADAHSKLAQAHRQLQETQQQMVLQGKMAGLGTLTAGVAHEINNPTNFVHVAAQNQREDIAEFKHFLDDMIEAEDAPEIVEGINGRFGKLSNGVITMLNGTERIKGIVRDLRSFTRLDQADKKAVRLSECLGSTLNLVRTSWLEKVEFVTDFADDPEIECWPALLNQVFMNLLVNGCQAIEERTSQMAATGGDDEATPAPAVRGKLWLRLHIDALHNNAVIDFEDSGVGMDALTQARIMEPFYTTKEVGKGTGLGLSIAFGIVEKHGGSLNFRSVAGVGSCFTIRLPLAPQDAAQALRHNPSNQDREGSP
jgi:signal transduction histidine kinase